MENIELDRIKDTVYELEGLLELARLREDKTEELLPLMRSRLAELNRLFKSPAAGEGREGVKETTDMRDTTADDAAEAEPEEEPEEEPIQEEQVEEEVYSLPETEDLPEAADNAVYSETSASTETPDYGVSEDTVYSGTSGLSASKPLPRPAFCINDRFRFRRELFNNSDSEFSSAMDIVATMDNYEEAEEYFIGDLGWNEENEDVIAFLDIIRQYFEK